MEFDLEVIERQFVEMNHKIKILEYYRNMTPEEFSREPGRILAVEHGLQILIQIMIDIGLHILSRMGRNKIETYAEVFDALGEENILDRNFALLTRKMAGFRNILVHEYTKIDEKVVMNYLRQNLDDFFEFQRQIRNYLKR